MSQALTGGAGGPAPGNILVGALARAVAAVAAEIRARRDLHALQLLDERQLHDIGVGAGELDHAVRNGRPRSPAHPSRADAVPPAPMPASWTEWR